MNGTQQMEGSMKEYVGSTIPEHTKQWHTKPVGAKVCPTCQCANVRAGVRHRIREDETGYWYEKIIKVCYGRFEQIETSVQRYQY